VLSFKWNLGINQKDILDLEFQNQTHANNLDKAINNLGGERSLKDAPCD